jgi:hypothetical protein
VKDWSPWIAVLFLLLAATMFVISWITAAPRAGHTRKTIEFGVIVVKEPAS